MSCTTEGQLTWPRRSDTCGGSKCVLFTSQQPKFFWGSNWEGPLGVPPYYSTQNLVRPEATSDLEESQGGGRHCPCCHPPQDQGGGDLLPNPPKARPHAPHHRPGSGCTESNAQSKRLYDLPLLFEFVVYSLLTL